MSKLLRAAVRDSTQLAVAALGCAMLLQRTAVWPRTGVWNLPEWLALAVAAGASLVSLQRAAVAPIPIAVPGYLVLLVSFVPAIILQATEPIASVTLLTRCAVGLLVIFAVSRSMTTSDAIRLTERLLYAVVLVAAFERAVSFAMEGAGTESAPWYVSRGESVLTLYASDVGIVGVYLVALALLKSRDSDRSRVVDAQIVLGWVLVLSQSHRAGLFSMTLVLLLAWRELPRSRRWALAAGWSAALLISQMVDRGLRIVSTDDAVGPSIGGTRRAMWQEVPGLVADSPVIGWGVQSGVEHQLRERWSFDRPSQTRQVHNTWLDVLISGGVLSGLAFVAFVGALVWIARRAWQHGDRLPAGFLAVWGIESMVLGVERLGWAWLPMMLVLCRTAGEQPEQPTAPESATPYARPTR